MPQREMVTMESKSNLLGWILAAIFAAVAAGMAVGFFDARQQIKQAGVTLATQSSTSSELLAQAHNEILSLKQRVAELEKTPAQAPPPEADTAATNAAEPPPDIMDSLMAGIKPNTATQGSDGDNNPLAAFSKMFEGEAGAKMAEYSVGVAAEMAYKDLFSQLKLSKDVEDQVRSIFRDHLADQIKSSTNAMKEGGGKAQMDKDKADAKTRLKERLSTVLSPQELAQWEQYEDSLEEHLLARQYEMQLGMMAPGLTPENREAVVNVLVEEAIAAEGNISKTDNVFQAGIDMQSTVMDNTLERISASGQFDESQMAELKRFADMWKQQMDMARELFNQKGNQQ